MTSAKLTRVLLLILAALPLAAQQRNYNPAEVAAGGRVYQGTCAGCHGLEGDSIPGVDFRRGEFRRASSDEELARIITNGIPGTPMPPTNFAGGQALVVVAYLRSLRNAVPHPSAKGDPRRGQALFEGKGACLGCHRVHGKGSRLGPDLSDVGVLRQAGELESHILDPNAGILPQNRTVEAVTSDGVKITGRRLNEDTHTVQILDSGERLVSLTKAALRSYTVLKTSPMPSYKGKLSSAELVDLVSYLVSLKGTP